MEPLEAVVAARALLAGKTPLKKDCGRYCGAACCQSDEDGQGGMLLFPGEDALYDPLPEGFRMERNDQVLPGAKLLICPGDCSRDARPLACRLFPLLPLIGDGGEVRVVTDLRAKAVCPLARQGKSAMDPAFTAAVREAGEILAKEEEQALFLELLEEEQQELRELGRRLKGGTR